MRQTVEAVYEGGVLRPITRLDLAEGQRVRIALDGAVSDDPLTLAAGVYEGLSPEDIREVERVALQRRAFSE